MMPMVWYVVPPLKWCIYGFTVEMMHIMVTYGVVLPSKWCTTVWFFWQIGAFSMTSQTKCVVISNGKLCVVSQAKLIHGIWVSFWRELCVIFPSKFKHALITPLLKKPGLSKSDPSNFRPISNLNTIGKILERLALARLLPHLSISPSFSPLQSAYRKFHSTETALLKLTNDIMDAIDSGKVTILAALDMSAAFDTLDHTTLLHRLEHTFGLSGTVHTWIHSYLTNRSSFVRIDSSSSSCDTSLTGVPHGSVLGPLLFVLFISPVVDVIGLIPDTQNMSEMVSFHQYADDTQLYIGANSSTLIAQIASIESCTQRVHDWLLNNGLHLNPSKSEAIAFSNPRSKPLVALAESVKTITVAGSPIKLQSSINYNKKQDCFSRVVMVTDEKPQILNCNIQFYFKWIVQTITFKLWDKTQFKCNGLFYWFGKELNITI